MDRRAFLRRSGAAAVGLTALGKLQGAPAAAAVDPRLRSLALAVRGRVITPASPLYAPAKRVFNERYSGTRPLAIVQPESVDDVRTTVLWAQEHDVQLAARSGGHSYGGYSTTRGVVVDLSRLNRIAVGAGGATIGAGARLMDVYSVLSRRGVAIPAGSCPTVGIGGHALGGGVGLASRRMGTTADNVRSLRLVTADGRVLTCNARQNADLYWACRGGGGGNFGIVTDFDFRVHRVADVSYYVASWPWSQAEEVIRAWQAFAPHAPDELFSLCALGSGRSVHSFGQFFGTEAQLRAVLGPLQRVSGISLTTGSSSYLDAQLRWAGCLGETIPECRRFEPTEFAAKSDYARLPLSAAGARTLTVWLERAQAAGFGSASVLLDSYGGAINRVPARATAFVHRDALFSIQYLAYWSATEAAALRWLRAAHAAMRPHVSGFAYQNYIDPGLAPWAHAYYGKNLARLETVKKRYDPDFFFRFPQAIRPA